MWTLSTYAENKLVVRTRCSLTACSSLSINPCQETSLPFSTLPQSHPQTYSNFRGRAALNKTAIHCKRQEMLTLTVCMYVVMCVCVFGFSCVQLSVTPWALACQALLPMEFSRQEYWRGFPFLSPEDFPDSGIEPASLVSPSLTGGFFTTAPPGKPH